MFIFTLGKKKKRKKKHKENIDFIETIFRERARLTRNEKPGHVYNTAALLKMLLED